VVHISNIDTLRSIYDGYYHSFIPDGIVFGVILPTVGRFSLYKRKLPELWLVHSPELLVGV
jgi:hypothetical protein